MSLNGDGLTLGHHHKLIHSSHKLNESTPANEFEGGILDSMYWPSVVNFDGSLPIIIRRISNMPEFSEITFFVSGNRDLQFTTQGGYLFLLNRNLSYSTLILAPLTTAKFMSVGGDKAILLHTTGRLS